MSSASVDLSEYPPWIVLFPSKVLDVVCDPLYFCRDWRLLIPVYGDWLAAYKVGDVTASFPHLTTFEEFNGTLWEYAFETPSTALGDVTTPTAMVVLATLVLLLRLVKSILMPYFSSVGRKAGRRTHGVDWEEQNELRILKFGEYVFRLLYHFCITVVGFWYFSDKEWWDPERGGTKNLFMGYPSHPIQPGMTWYYLVQSAYNLEALLSLVELSFVVRFHSFSSGRFPVTVGWSETVRGDFQEMFVHHIVTNLLVIGSSWIRMTRAGSMMFMVHDISDVPVDLSKLANFLKWKVSTAICFATMVALWFYYRLVVLPFTIYKAVLTEAILVVEHDFVDAIFYKCYQPFFAVLIGLIIFLHLAWFGMFLQMGYLLLFKGETHDLTEHKKGEAQDRLDGNNGVATRNGESHENGRKKTS